MALIDNALLLLLVRPSLPYCPALLQYFLYRKQPLPSKYARPFNPRFPSHDTYAKAGTTLAVASHSNTSVLRSQQFSVAVRTTRRWWLPPPISRAASTQTTAKTVVGSDLASNNHYIAHPPLPAHVEPALATIQFRLRSSLCMAGRHLMCKGGSFFSGKIGIIATCRTCPMPIHGAYAPVDSFLRPSRRLRLFCLTGQGSIGPASLVMLAQFCFRTGRDCSTARTPAVRAG